ncbi:MAG: HepT-like ribonuclease domain-containing protein [Pseudomonadota bacterium]
MPEYTYAKGRIAESIQFISQEMCEFDAEYSRITWEEYRTDTKKQKLIDRTVENILNALIEICGTVLAEKGISADSYAQTLSLAAKNAGLSAKQAQALGQLAFHRNRLVHRYLDLKWQTIMVYKKQISQIKSLLNSLVNKK